jgi:hypothetical protein
VVQLRDNMEEFSPLAADAGQGKVREFGEPHG